jgi:predicted S18 family serine protease
VIHYDRLLDAERAALDGKSNAALKHYQSAVSMAARGGFVHNTALANERYAEYLLHGMSDSQEAVFYFEEAIRFYSEWGALKKVHLLREKFPICGRTLSCQKAVNFSSFFRSWFE